MGTIHGSMAKPIEPTPVLKGGDAKEFLRLTFEAEKKPDEKFLLKFFSSGNL